MTSRTVDARPSYENTSQHLADLAENVRLRLSRLDLIRKLPRAVITAELERRRAVRDVPALALLDQQIRTGVLEIRRRADYARRLGIELPLETLRTRMALTPLDVELLVTQATLDRGVVFNPYHASGQEPITADVALLIALHADAEHTAEDVRLRFVADAPLVAGSLLELMGTADQPLVYKRVRLADRVLEYLEGATSPPPAVLGVAATFTPLREGDEVLLPDPTLIGQVARALSRRDQVVEVVGPPGVGRKSLLIAAAQQLGRPTLAIDMRELPGDPRGLDGALRVMQREAHLQDAVLILDGAHELPSEDGTTSSPAKRLAEQMRQVRVPVAVVSEKSLPWLPRLGRVVVSFVVPLPSEEVQRRLWIRHLPPSLGLHPSVALASIVKRYSTSGGAIVDACDELGRLDTIHQRGGVITEEHLVDVIRSRLAHRLGALASSVHTTLKWDDVILPDEVLAPVFEFLNYAAHREQVFHSWGFDRKLPYGRGLSALFSGPPGTGKTMICSLLAKELGLELYRIDLSQVVNKYIGETEKNLGRVFDEASRGQVMLLFDEADSMFAKRTEVKSSHDRYANLEVNYLLQRLEAHEGVVVMTTNAETAIDPAFRRRIRFRIRFPAPDEGQRARLWEGMLPKEAQLADDVDLSVLAKRFPLAGGSIMNALVRAATAAASDGGIIHQRHLLRAAEMEFAEMGFLT